MYTCCRDGQQKENTAPRKTSQKRKCSASRKLPDIIILLGQNDSNRVPSWKLSLIYHLYRTSDPVQIDIFSTAILKGRYPEGMLNETILSETLGEHYS